MKHKGTKTQRGEGCERCPFACVHGRGKRIIGNEDAPAGKGFTGRKLLEQMKQLLAPVRDDEIADVRMRDHLVLGGVVGRVEGLNFLTDKGVQWAVSLELARPGELPGAAVAVESNWNLTGARR